MKNNNLFVVKEEKIFLRERKRETMIYLQLFS